MATAAWMSSVEHIRATPGYPDGHDVSAQSWVRASHAELDGPLADALVDWIRDDWPWECPFRYGR